MWRHTTIAIRFAVVTTALLGLVYPLVMTGLAQVIFPRQANGSLVRRDGNVIGSELIGQTFGKPEYFHARPSAAFDPSPSDGKGAQPDNWVSGGSNLGPTSRALADRVGADVKRLSSGNPGLEPGMVPADMVTTSGSGFDPHISPANAYAQVARVASARGMSESELRRIVKGHIEGRQFGVLGEPRVNVLRLNIALDAMESDDGR